MNEMIRTCVMNGEDEGGAETVEIVFGIIVAVGLGAALLAFQGQLRMAITNAGTQIGTVFSSLAAGASS